MLTIGICLILGSIVSVIVVACDWTELTMPVVLCFGFFGFCLAFVLGSGAPYTIVTETEYIYSLNDTSSVEGSFILGSGNVDGKLEYRYFIENDDGYLEYRSISADGIQITFDDTPRIERYNKKFEESIWCFPCNIEPIPETTLFIPEDCIIKDVSIDLE